MLPCSMRIGISAQSEPKLHLDFPRLVKQATKHSNGALGRGANLAQGLLEGFWGWLWFSFRAARNTPRAPFAFRFAHFYEDRTAIRQGEFNKMFHNHPPHETSLMLGR